MSLDDQMARIDRAMEVARSAPADRAWEAWLVKLPDYRRDGVTIRKLVITEREAFIDEFRAALNPQRSNRAVQVGTYTQLIVDGVLWMTDTPAEIEDLRAVGHQLAWASSALIVGLGLGVIVNRAIALGVKRIDVVEIDQRIITAVGPQYAMRARAAGATLTYHCADIHAWRSPVEHWDVGWFDIWASIDTDDLGEVARLRRRFRKRLGWFGAWGQDERLASKRRIALGLGFY